MKTRPIYLKEANEFVRRFHRHNTPVVGGRFSISAEDMNGTRVGVAICGRPIARMLDDGKTLEVLRLCTDGTKNANSYLFDKCRKIGALMGYERVITYTLERESGSSLRAIGATSRQASHPRSWNSTGRPRKDQTVYHEPKFIWTL